jgi:NitT/TauT family transport system substrate-binding protein
MWLKRFGWSAVPVIVVAIGGIASWCSVRWMALPAPNSSQWVPRCAGLLGRPLRVGIVTWPGFAGGIVANNGFEPNQDSLYYRQHNLCVEFLLMEDVDVREKAFARGGKDGLDIVWSTVDSSANELPGFRKSGIAARVIMQTDWSRGGDAIVADQSIQRIEDLLSKRISLALFTPSHWLLEYNLSHSSLTEAQQHQIVRTLVGMQASPDARAAFVSRKVDAAVLWEPDVSAALRQRPYSQILVSSAQATKLIANVMVAKADFIQAHSDVVRAFVEGWVVDGTQQANRAPDTVARLLGQNEPIYQELGREATLKTLATVKWAGLADNVEMFNLDGKDPEPLFDSIFKQAAMSWVARGYISAPVAPAVARDDRFVRDIYQRRGPVARVPDELAPPVNVAGQTPIFETHLTVAFAAGSSQLDAAARQAIDKEALLPKAFSGSYIQVEGNTDNLGDPVVSRELSRRRAQAVVDYLVSQYHLPRNQFIAVGNGPDKPIASNSSAEGRAKNRRTDLMIVSRPPG